MLCNPNGKFMRILALILGVFFCLGVFLDAFQTIILPRRPKGRFRITRLFFLVTWNPWVALGDRLKNQRVRDQFFSIYGPLSLLLLLAVWATLLSSGFTLIYYSLGSPFHDAFNVHGQLGAELSTDFYVSGTTLFTLGLGDVLPQTHISRLLLVLESGVGLGFVALVIGYLPVLYQAFSRREVSVALLDGRAGSPPTAAELLRRHGYKGGDISLIALLVEWERWSAEILESHVSYPILCYYRSQHDNQSWLAALTAVLDTCALLITSIEGPSARQAQLTFAIGRHTLVDLGHVFKQEKQEQRLRGEAPQRLGDEEFARLCDLLAQAGFSLCGDVGARERLNAIRVLYEPHACALANYLRLQLPGWVPPDAKKRDGWSTVAELRSPSAIGDRLTAHVSAQSTARHLEGER